MGGSSSKHLVRKIGETLASEESYKLTPSDLKRLWSHYDADKSGFLSRDGVCPLCVCVSLRWGVLLRVVGRVFARAAHL